jgi:hypothetical protein
MAMLGTEAFYKTQLEKLQKENAGLKEKVESLEMDNRELKNSVYQLSVKYVSLFSYVGGIFHPRSNE